MPDTNWKARAQAVGTNPGDWKSRATASPPTGDMTQVPLSSEHYGNPDGSAPGKSTGEGNGEGFKNPYGESQTFSERISDPERWKAILGMPSKASENVIEGSAPLALPASALPGAVGRLANFLGGSRIKRIATNTVAGAATHPDKPGEGAMFGALTGVGGEALSGLLGKGGDALMQASVGQSHYTPGMGTALADEGLIGTKGMMRGQVNRALSNRGEEINRIADSIPPEIQSDPAGTIAGDIQAHQKAHMVPPGGGTPSSADQPKINTIDNFTNDLSERGPETAPEQLQRRIAAGKRGYRGVEDPIQSLIGKMSQQEQAGYSSSLKDLAGQVSPDLAEDLSGADTAYGALKGAKTSLNQKAPLEMPKSLFSALTSLVKGVTGGSLGSSALSQVMSKGSPMARWAPLIESIREEEQKVKNRDLQQQPENADLQK